MNHILLQSLLLAKMPYPPHLLPRSMKILGLMRNGSVTYSIVRTGQRQCSIGFYNQQLLQCKGDADK
ncbi:hypothetical protein [Oceanobacillus sp. FSL H7-0719]|uniref:hypothetical protein n=1 Tax=Oceanobacillus sp. FSL H7-0719 TaxID=2954507 RepID=UPI00324E470B